MGWVAEENGNKVEVEVEDELGNFVIKNKSPCH